MRKAVDIQKAWFKSSMDLYTIPTGSFRIAYGQGRSFKKSENLKSKKNKLVDSEALITLKKFNAKTKK